MVVLGVLAPIPQLLCNFPIGAPPYFPGQERELMMTQLEGRGSRVVGKGGGGMEWYTGMVCNLLAQVVPFIDLRLFNVTA